VKRTSQKAALLRLLPLNLALVALFVAGGFMPTHSVATSSQANLAGLKTMLRIMGREGVAADPDQVRLARKGQEGPIRSAEADAYYERAFPKDTIPADAYPNGIRQFNYVTEYSFSIGWQELGPDHTPNANSPNPLTGASTTVSGRVAALAVDPTSCIGSVCNTIYLGTANGGVWKTTNAGQTWTPLFDHQLNEAIGIITLDPVNPNIVYVGTGEPNTSADSNHGIGILRSTDGGQTWTDLGYDQFVNRAVAGLVIDPRTAGSTHATLYVTTFQAVSGGAMTGGACRACNPYLPPVGFYRSTDGGQTWTYADPTGANIGAESLVMDPSDPNTLYAAFTDYGIYKSTNDGTSWTRLSTGLPAPGFTTPSVLGRITLAIAPSNPQVLYAAYNLNDSEAFFQSTDGGASWTLQENTPDACDGQCWYDMPLAVDPTNPTVVYAGGSANYGYLSGSQPECATFYPLPTDCNATLMKSTDGGNTWADVAENGNNGPLHPDDHVIVIDPRNHNVIYTGTDGGIFHSANGATSWDDLNSGVGSLQFQGLAIGPTGHIFAGTQDNGTFRYDGSTTWVHFNAGDGGPTAADPTNPNIAYSSFFGAQLFRNDNALGPNPVAHQTWIAPFWGDYSLLGRGRFYEPYAVAPSSPNDIFYGTFRIWRSELRGGIDGNHDGDATNDPTDTIDWVPISPDLSGPNGGISAVAVSPVDPNVVAVGTSLGKLYLTTNALAPVTTDISCDPRLNELDYSLCSYVSGPTWTEIDTGLPRRYPTSIRFAPGSSTTLYVTFSGFSENTPGQPSHVFVSKNRGTTWTEIDGTGAGTTLPDLPANDIVIDPSNHLFVAQDYGVFYSANGGHTWKRIDWGLPNVPVYRMEYFAPWHALIVNTHGRGIWKLRAP
jgi:photosystem II stability/assembly factor-like uncharacterized protein